MPASSARVWRPEVNTFDARGGGLSRRRVLKLVGRAKHLPAFSGPSLAQVSALRGYVGGLGSVEAGRRFLEQRSIEVARNCTEVRVLAAFRRALEQGPAGGRMSPRGDHRHPTPVFDGLPIFLEWKRCKPRRICTELRRFWNADCPQTRMDAHSEHSPVTPGVAGSSPVHSATKHARNAHDKWAFSFVPT